MPQWVQYILLAAPTTHFVMLAQGILYRGAGLSAVWPQFLALPVIGTILFKYRPRTLPQDHWADVICGEGGPSPRVEPSAYAPGSP